MGDKNWKLPMLWLLAREEGGQGLVEYTIILMVIALAVIAALSKVAPPLVDTFHKVENEFRSWRGATYLRERCKPASGEPGGLS